MKKLIIRPALLSSRFENDGRANGRLKREQRALIDRLRQALESGEIERRERENCPLCHGLQARLIAKKDRLGLPLDTLVCESCGLVFSPSYFTDKGVNLYYSTYCNQIKNEGRSSEKMFADRTQLGAYAWKRFRWINNVLGEDINKMRTVMEVGCNDGCNLYPFHVNGFKVMGCDFDEERMRPGRNAGLTLLTGGLDVLKASGERADLLILSHSLEHMGDPDRVLNEAGGLLNKGGKLYVEVPGLKHWNRIRSQAISDEWTVSGNDFLAYLQLEHNFCFDQVTLLRFASRNGLSAVKVDEFVRALFKRGGNEQFLPEEGPNRDQRVYQYLSDLEKDWKSSNPWWKRVARKIKGWVNAEL